MMEMMDRRLLEPEFNSNKQPTEREEWDRAGCNNNKEWHAYLVQQSWREYTCDIRDDCYVGTHETNLKRFRRKTEEDY